MADQFPMLSLTPDVPDPVAPSAAPAQSIQQQPAAPASATSDKVMFYFFLHIIPQKNSS